MEGTGERYGHRMSEKERGIVKKRERYKEGRERLVTAGKREKGRETVSTRRTLLPVTTNDGQIQTYTAYYQNKYLDGTEL